MLVITSENVVLPDKKEGPATVEVDALTGKIIAVHEGKKRKADYPSDVDFNDVGHQYLLPGLVDPHVHFNEPGRTEWEGFFTGTKAALSGGVTTVIDMPLNSIPPTTTAENLEVKRRAAAGQCWTDVGFWGGVIPGNSDNLKSMVEAGVKGFKCFLVESGVDEFPCVSEDDLRIALPKLKGLPTRMLFHAEVDSKHVHNKLAQGLTARTYDSFLRSRPDSFETDALSLILRLSTLSDVPLHIVHLSSAQCIPTIREAKSRGVRLTVETCFHYLCLEAEMIRPGRTEFKCSPPIRTSENRDALWEGLKEGVIDFVVSDHSPCVAALKQIDRPGGGDFMEAWGGISSLGLGLSLLWTEAQKRGVGIPSIAQWTSAAPAQFAGLEGKKGAIKVGNDADLVVWDPDQQFAVTKASLNFKNKLTPYMGMDLRGRVVKTFLRGKLAFDVEGREGLRPMGELL